MPLITPAVLREHLETDLVDDALERVIDSEEAEIVSRYGAHVTQVDALRGRGPHVYLTRPAASITTVTEQAQTSTTVTTLASDDYRKWPTSNTRYLERVTNGTNPSALWEDIVTVTYVPQDETAERTRVLIDLCKLAIAYQGYDSQRMGDYQESVKNYPEMREALLAQLGQSRGLVFA